MAKSYIPITEMYMINDDVAWRAWVLLLAELQNGKYLIQENTDVVIYKTLQRAQKNLEKRLEDARKNNYTIRKID